MEETTKHALDDEEVAIVVSLTHGPTLTQAVGVAEAHEGRSIVEAVQSAGEQAMDGLLAQLEVIGG